MNGTDLTRAFLETLRPPKRQTVSEWADENRVLASESSSAPGRWRTALAPYQREVMDCFTDREVERVVMMFGSQVGKTEIMLNMAMRAIDADPGPMVYVNATTLFSEDFSKRRFAPAVRVCPAIAGRMADVRARDSSNTITMKTFPGGSIAFIGASSPVELAGRPIRYVFGDEIDRWPLSAGSEGDPIKLVERRAETFRNRKLVYVSTPTLKGESRIETEYLLGTQEEWRQACPGCGALRYLRWEDMRYEYTAHEANGETTFRIRHIRWACPECGGEFSEREMKGAPAQWVALNPEALSERRTRSFHLNAFSSPWARWSDIIREYLEAGKDVHRLQVFFNTRLGEPWAQVETTELPDRLYMRREHYEADVPNGALLLTLGVDTQDNRLEYEVVGWGEGEESWGIRRGIIPGRADTPQPWQELEELMRYRFSRADGHAMPIACGFMDSGGHFTQDVYRRTRDMQRRGIKLFAIKGVDGDDRQYVEMGKAGTGGGVLFKIAVDSGKAAIMFNASIAEWGPGYMHFPDNEGFGYERDYFRSLISERMELHVFRGRQRMGWHKIYDRNEALDCRNYARAAFKGFDWRLSALKARYARARRRDEEDAQSGDAPREDMPRRKKSAYISRGVQV